MKKILSLVLVIIFAFSFIGCSDNQVEESNSTDVKESSIYPMTIVDGIDREIVIESEVMKVVSVAPSITEVIYALGLGDRLVGRTDYCNYPEEVLSVESIGSLTEPNVESIIALNPDVVIGSSHFKEDVLIQIEDAGIKVIILKAEESFEGAYDVISKAGVIFDVTDKAIEIVEQMKANVSEVVTALENVEKKSVYYVVEFGEYGDYTATGDTFIHEMLEMAGGSNIASDGKMWSYNIESIIAKDPEVIICSENFDTKVNLEKTDGYKDLTAIKESRLLEIDQDILSRQGPRLAEGLKAIAKLLHPEVFN